MREIYFIYMIFKLFLKISSRICPCLKFQNYTAKHENVTRFSIHKNPKKIKITNTFKKQQQTTIKKRKKDYLICLHACICETSYHLWKGKGITFDKQIYLVVNIQRHFLTKSIRYTSIISYKKFP